MLDDIDEAFFSKDIQPSKRCAGRTVCGAGQLAEKRRARFGPTDEQAEQNVPGRVGEHRPVREIAQPPLSLSIESFGGISAGIIGKAPIGEGLAISSSFWACPMWIPDGFCSMQPLIESPLLLSHIASPHIERTFRSVTHQSCNINA